MKLRVNLALPWSNAADHSSCAVSNCQFSNTDTFPCYVRFSRLTLFPQRIKIPHNRRKKRRALAPPHHPETLPRQPRRPRHIIQRNPAPPPLPVQPANDPPAPTLHLLIRNPPLRHPPLPRLLPLPLPLRLPRRGPLRFTAAPARTAATPGIPGGRGFRSGFRWLTLGLHKGEQDRRQTAPQPPGLPPAPRMDDGCQTPSYARRFSKLSGLGQVQRMGGKRGVEMAIQPLPLALMRRIRLS